MGDHNFVLPANGYRLANVSVPIAMLSDAAAFLESNEVSILVDIDVDANGYIQRIANSGTIPKSNENLTAIGLGGRQLWAGLIDAHAHIDKAYTWARAPNKTGTLDGARGAAKDDRSRAWDASDVKKRMDFAIRCAIAHGTTGLRTHIDSQPDRALPSWPVFQALQTKWSALIEMQAVATLGISKLTGSYGDDVCKLAKTHNAKALGPVVYRSDNLENELLHSFELAEKYHLDLDFHVDETDDPAAEGLRAIAKLATGRGFKGRIVCGHACSLSVQDTARAKSTIAIARDAGLGIICLPSSNLFLQDRRQSTPTWRGVTLVMELAAAGVPVAIAGDNSGDAFNPFADLDMVDAFRDAVRLAHLDQPSVDDWLGAISTIPASITGMTRSSGKISEGGRADFVIFQGRTVHEVIARCGRDRVVVRNGQATDVRLPSYAELDSQNWRD